ncbi:MAG: hypothetical protein ACK456_13580 [Pseudanabaenaceae cyanobacterium]
MQGTIELTASSAALEGCVSSYSHRPMNISNLKKVCLSAFLSLGVIAVSLPVLAADPTTKPSPKPTSAVKPTKPPAVKPPVVKPSPKPTKPAVTKPPVVKPSPKPTPKPTSIKPPVKPIVKPTVKPPVPKPPVPPKP